MRLTPNQRMAVYLSSVNSSKSSNSINSSINHSPAYSFSNWITVLWENLRKNVPEANLPQILSQGEQESLIEKIIEDILDEMTENDSFKSFDSFNQNETTGIHFTANISTNIFKSAALARLIIDAYQLMQEWCLESERVEDFQNSMFDNPIFDISLEKKLYQQTIIKYQEQCQANNWIDQVSLPAKIMTITKETKQVRQEFGQKFELHKELLKILPKKIECIGFLEWTPIQKEFRSCLENLGIRVSDTSLLSTSSLNILNIPHQNHNQNSNKCHNRKIGQKTYVIAAENPLKELQLAVLHARNWLHSKKSSQNSDKLHNSDQQFRTHSFAIVIPESQSTTFAN